MAAFDFPNSPSTNDVYTANGVSFKWNGTIWQRISASTGAQGGTGSTGPTGAQGAAAGLTISTSAPGSPSAGDMWWDSDSGLFLTYYNDGNSSQWVELNQGPKGAQGATGSTGAQGATGPTGAQGAAGAQGATGAAGSNASISSNADNRVITGGSGTNLVGETNLTFDGSTLGVNGNLSIAEKIIHTGDTNCFISFPAADQIVFEGGGHERFRINGTTGKYLFGRDITGRSANYNNTGVVPTIQIEDDTEASFSVAKFSNNTDSSRIYLQKGRGSTGSAAIVQDNDTLGMIVFNGYNGSGFRNAAQILAEVDGTPTSSGDDSDMPGALVFKTSEDGTNVPTEKLRIASDGQATFDKGAPGSSNQVISRFQAESSRRLDIVWHDSGSLMGFDTPSSHSYIFKIGGSEKLRLRNPGSNRGSLEVFGTFNESTTPAIEINYNNDARKVFLTNSAGDFNALTRNGSQTKGQLKMFESGILLHNMKDPDSTSVLQTIRAGVYKVTTGSTYTSISPITHYITKGGSGTYDAFEEGNCELVVNGLSNSDHYQPIGFVPRGYNLDQTSFGGQWAGEMWIHQVGSQNPVDYGYNSSSYNTWATMSFKCKWDSAHWNAKPSGFWVEHYINYGRANIAKIDASGTQSQFVIYLLPGRYKIRFNCVRGMSVHRAVSDGAALVMRDGGSFVTYSTLAYSSRNTAFDSEITQGSTFQHST